MKRALIMILYSGGVHKSKSDRKDHATVDYKKSDGTHVSTKHIYMSPP